MAANDLKQVDQSNTIEYQRTAINEISSDIHSLFAGTANLENGLRLSGLLKESINIVNGPLSANSNINIANGMIHYFTSTETTTSVPNIAFDQSTPLYSKMNVGEVMTLILITTPSSTGYPNGFQIDGFVPMQLWSGGSSPSSGGSGGLDVYTYMIIRTSSNPDGYMILSSSANYN